MFLLQRDFRSPSFGLWQIVETVAPGIGFLSLGAGEQGHSGALGAMIARAVGEAVVLTAHGKRATLAPKASEVGASVVVEWSRMVAAAKLLAGHGATGTRLIFVDGGADAWHG
jgi:hypothetical protein